MDFIVSGLPSTVALAAVAVIAYLFGRGNAKKLHDERAEIRRDTKKAKAVIRDLERIAQQIRRDLAGHHTNVLGFKSRVAELSHSPGEDVFRQLCQEAEKMLSPTMRLATQIAHAYDELRQQTTHLLSFTEIRTDPLTGLGNRRTLDETLKHMFAVKGRYRTTFSLAIFDLDRFKTVNDEHGHLHGDHVLQLVARAIEQCIRETDTVVRYGGEEFVVILPEIGLHEAAVFADRLRHAVDSADNISVTVSGGVAEAMADDTARTLLSRADAALYSAKADGRNCVFKHTGSDIEPMNDRSTLPDSKGSSADDDAASTVERPGQMPLEMLGGTSGETPALLPGQATTFLTTMVATPAPDAAH
jgi:diguanylate cyclase